MTLSDQSQRRKPDCDHNDAGKPAKAVNPGVQPGAYRTNRHDQAIPLGADDHTGIRVDAGGLAAQVEVEPIEIRATTPEPGRVGPETGYPLPRFVSMDVAEGRARRGPSRSHRIDWVYTCRGMPLIIIAEHGHWRRVVDQDGEGGWMHYSLLTGVRTGIVETDMVEMRTRPDATAPVRAQAELGVIGRLQECADGWCLFASDGYRGWVPQEALWGTVPGEVIE